MRRGRAPFQHVEPPRIVGEMHADMVGNEIENKPEIVLLQRRAQPLEAGFAAELRIDPGMIDDIIAMGAALARFHEGRCVEMRDAERLQIGDDGGRGVEIEIRRELQRGRSRSEWPEASARVQTPEYRPGRQVPIAAARRPRSACPLLRLDVRRVVRKIGQQLQRCVIAQAPVGGQQAIVGGMRPAKGRAREPWNDFLPAYRKKFSHQRQSLRAGRIIALFPIQHRGFKCFSIQWIGNFIAKFG